MNDKMKIVLSDINKKMDSIRRLTEPIRKISNTINNNPALKNFNYLSNKIRESFPAPKINADMIDDALKKNDLLETNEPVIRTMPNIMQSLDNRSRSELKEDFETKILETDRKKINLLIDILEKIKDNEGIAQFEINDLEENVIITLTKYERTISTFEALNSELAVQLDYKKNELEFIAKADWKAKFRLFFFRVLWTFLFISGLFFVGYIDHEYEWAHLPMAKYFSKQITK